MLDLVGLPKNTNGFRTTHTCELCGFEPKTKNKYREKQDHLVMKHFKEKIDKIFPHCRPYTCPTPECEFTGKDKQALLRHYTGKHGILEQFLREALSERGINYAPGDHPKRKNSTEGRRNRSSPSTTMRTAIIMPQMVPKLPTAPISSLRPNNEDLKREVEAMMASLQPNPPPGATSLVVLPTLPSLNVSKVDVKVENNVKEENVLKNVTNNGQISINLPTVPLGSQMSAAPKLPTSPLPQGLVLPQEPAKLPPLINRNVHLARRSPPPPSALPSLILPEGTPNGVTLPTLPSVLTLHQSKMIPKMPFSSSSLPLPIDSLSGPRNSVTSDPSSTPPSSIAMDDPSELNTDQAVVLENEEVMWSAPHGPAVVVEVADTVPVTYIESTGMNGSNEQSVYIDNMEYDYLYSSGTPSAPEHPVGAGASVRERQLDFCML